MKSWKELTLKEKMSQGLDSIIIGLGTTIIIALIPFDKFFGISISLGILAVWLFMIAENNKQTYQIIYEIQKQKEVKKNGD